MKSELTGKPAWLRNLLTMKVALTDEGANPDAAIVLYKSKRQEANSMKSDDVTEWERVEKQVLETERLEGPESPQYMLAMARRFELLGHADQAAAWRLQASATAPGEEA